MNLGQVQAPEA